MECVARRAFPAAHLEVFYERVLISAAGAGLRRRVESPDPANLRAVFEGLVLKESEEFRPSCIGYGFCEMMIPHHALHIEILYGDDLVFAHQPESFFVEKVHARVIYLLVDSGHSYALLRAIGGTFLLARQPTLLTTEFAFIRTKMLGVIYYIAITVSVEFRKPDIDADHAAGVRLRDKFFLAAERHEVFARRGLRYGGVENASVRKTGYLRLHCAELRKHDAVPFDTDAAALIARPLRLTVIVLALEAWIATTFCEEVLERPVEVPETLLQSHTVD